MKSAIQKRRNARTYLKDLTQILLSPRTPSEMERFAHDFFSPSEVRQFVERWLIGDLLLQGLTQREIKKKLGVSITKVSRGAYVLQYGQGGFRRTWENSQRKS